VNWSHSSVKTLISLALQEDQARHDATSRLLIPASARLKASIRAKQVGVVCGLPLGKMIFQAVQRSMTVKLLIKEGARVKPGQTLMTMSGAARAILEGERPALNAIQHLSGIATYTAQQVARLGKSKTKLLDTRKTIPGWRALEKYAVLCGGGDNHRMSLGDAVLVKENHIRIAREAGTDWVETLQKFRKKHPAFPVQIEVQTWDDLSDVIRVAPQRVLLDNLPVPTLKKMIRVLRQTLPNLEIEISGGVRPEDLHRLGKLGVERISMGRLTHSAPAFDCSLDIL